MRTVFINLDESSERRTFMEQQGKRLGLALERLPAVRSRDIDEATLQRLGRGWERPLSRSELGCFLSHHALWTQAARGSSPLLVLEDDVVLSPRFIGLADRIERLAGVELLNLESYDRRRFVARSAAALGPDAEIVRVYRDKSGSAAYVVWPDGARKLLQRATRGAAPVDAFLHGLKALASFQVEPAMAMQLHLLEKRGFAAPIAVATSIQASRDRLSVTAAGNLPFHLRRFGTQLDLAVEHLKRLVGRRYRRVDIDEADFRDVLPQRRS